MAFASSWNASYLRRPGHDGMLFAAEDGALWQQSDDAMSRVKPGGGGSSNRGGGSSNSYDGSINSYEGSSSSFHFLVHRFASGNGSTAGSEVGGHAYSHDGLVWTYSPHAAYNTTVRYGQTDHAQHSLYRRERPKPLFDHETGRWVALFNGAWPCHVGAEDDDTRDGAAGCESFTLMTQVGDGTADL
jgi:hypothetical protein